MALGYSQIRQLLVAMILLWVCLGQASLASASVDQAAVKQGAIDLREVNWEQEQYVMLDGEWTFYWEQLLEPATLRAVRPTSSYIHVPSLWSQSALSNQGFATYQVKLQLGANGMHRQMALYMPSVATAYKLWIDGKLMETNGIVGTSRESMVPKNYPKVVLFQADHPDVDVVIQVSNFVQRKGGLWESIKLGSADKVLFLQNKRMMYEGMIAACLLAMGSYHVALFLMRKKEKSVMYFGGICIAIAIRTLLLGETLAIRFFPQIPWEIGAKLEYLSAIGTMMLLLMFVHSQYPQETNRKIRNGCIGIGGLLFLFVLVCPPLIFTEQLAVKEAYLLVSYLYVLYVYVLAAIRKRFGSLLNGIGLFIFFLAIVNEILFYANLSTFENGVPLGLLLFLFTQMLNLSIMFARSFDHVERLSSELTIINGSLEEKVHQRTRALAEKNQELHRLEASRRHLLSNIAHELGTPLTSIQGFIKAMIDGVVRRDDPKYLTIIYEKTIYLHRIITDLFELTKMEARQARFHFQQLALQPFFRRMYEKYVIDMEKRGLLFKWEVLSQAEAGKEPVIMADPIRIEQVVANLLVNAQTYTPAGGTISIGIGWEIGQGGTGVAIVKVSDTGAGIEEESVPFVFDRFYKGSESRKIRSNGVGLGLAISKEIMENHQGSIGVESTLGAGSTFWFAMPARYEDARQEGEGKVS